MNVTEHHVHIYGNKFENIHVMDKLQHKLMTENLNITTSNKQISMNSNQSSPENETKTTNIVPVHITIWDSHESVALNFLFK
jgi:hypothetical protein